MSSITSVDSDPDLQDAWVDDFTADSGATSALLTECVTAHRYGWNIQLLLEQAQRPAVVSAATAATSRVPKKLVQRAQRDLAGLPAAAITLSLAFCMHRRGRGGRQSGPDPRLNPNIDPAKAQRIIANRRSAAVCKVQTKLGQLADTAWKAGLLSEYAAAAATVRAGGPSAAVPERSRRGAPAHNASMDAHFAAVAALPDAPGVNSAATSSSGRAETGGAAGARVDALPNSSASSSAGASAPSLCGSAGPNAAGSGTPSPDVTASIAGGFPNAGACTRVLAADAAFHGSSSPDAPVAPPGSAFNTTEFQVVQQQQDAATASAGSEHCALSRVASYLMVNSIDSPQLQLSPLLCSAELLSAQVAALQHQPWQPQPQHQQQQQHEQQPQQHQQPWQPQTGPGAVLTGTADVFTQLHRASSAPNDDRLLMDVSLDQACLQMQLEVQLEYDLLAAEAAAAAANGFRLDATTAALAAAGRRMQTPYATQPMSSTRPWSAGGWCGTEAGFGALQTAAASASAQPAAAGRRGPTRSVTFSGISPHMGPQAHSPLAAPAAVQQMQQAPLGPNPASLSSLGSMGSVVPNPAILGTLGSLGSEAAPRRRPPVRSATFSSPAMPASMGSSSSGSSLPEVPLRRVPPRSSSFSSSTAAAAVQQFGPAAGGVRKGPKKTASKTRLVGMQGVPPESPALQDIFTVNHQQQQMQQQMLYQAALAGTWSPSGDVASAVSPVPCQGGSSASAWALQPQSSWVADPGAAAAAAGAIPGAAAAVVPGSSYAFSPHLHSVPAARQYCSEPGVSVGADAGAACSPLHGLAHMGCNAHAVAALSPLPGASAAAAAAAGGAVTGLGSTASGALSSISMPQGPSQLQSGSWHGLAQAPGHAQNAATAHCVPPQQQQQQQQQQYLEALAAWQQQEEQLLLDMAHAAISHLSPPAAAGAAAGAPGSASAPAAAAAGAAGLVQQTAVGLQQHQAAAPAAQVQAPEAISPMEACSSAHAALKDSWVVPGAQQDVSNRAESSPVSHPAAAAAAAAAPAQMLQGAAHARPVPAGDVYTWLAPVPVPDPGIAPPGDLDLDLELELELDLALNAAAAAAEPQVPEPQARRDPQCVGHSVEQVAGCTSTAGDVPPQGAPERTTAAAAAAAVQDGSGGPQLPDEDVELWEELLGGVPDPLELQDATSPTGVDGVLWDLFEDEVNLDSVLMEQ